ncbi:acetyltransferase (GNAT) family protein [Gillisia mitskevichiae]|uniref:Acetyltransferase (GNAT) family protein n=1 Tax=Gillisia mitskevichiae TaxID=270921 RepID=A0A495PLK7_9FLAO|nr:GNAT family N-acetyltransferase [Gillisia mitskevichiae]RKS50585.1 acetyltransferase (GNAT) family protein [Gillisia mitskevichiae]
MENLNFREIDYQTDLSEVISLIHKNLDSTYTLDFFKWKHLENPFGKSYGLLALDGDKIIGLRMFMFWEFKTPNGKLKAIRPVDTVTDENYRGMGIFKKLTLDGLENISGEYDIVFNTPNNNSLPGYLKMGWRKMEKLDYFRVGLINPFAKSTIFLSILIDQINFKGEDSISIGGTILSDEFLKWRYKEPVYQIADFSSEGNYVIYKKSKINNIPSLIVYEIIGDPAQQRIMLISLAKKNKTPFIYYYGSDVKNGRFLKSFKRNGPVVVIKNDKYLIGDKLHFSLGDLEGKL